MPDNRFLGSAWRARFLVLGMALAAFCLASGGCRRGHYRKQADEEAYQLIREKSNDPRWMLTRTTLDIDPRSRMFDPFNPDRPPMPPDDPKSNELMYFLNGKRNYQKWEKDGTTPNVENPKFIDCLPLNEDGILELDLVTAVELALIHSPNYQEAYEDLYLSALDVSAERFEFDAQWFGGSDVFYYASGRNNGSPGSRLGPTRSELRVDSDLALRKAFITGADLVVNFANTIVWNFHGPDTNTSFSLLDFSFVQPLLREAGKDRVLTRLTLAERNLLANVRRMERFRQGFYLEIATGAGETRGPRRIGGLFGGSGLEGFTGVGGGFGGVGGVFGGGGGAGVASSLQVGGFLGLLQDRQNIRNQRTNIAGLRSNVISFQQTLNENLRQIPEDPTEVVRNRLQVAQARQTLYNQEFSLLTAEAQLQAQIDSLKINLGLPPDVGVLVSDPLLEQFNLLDTSILPLQEEVSQLSELVGATNEAILAQVQYEQIDGERVATIQWSSDLRDNLERLGRYLARIRRIRDVLLDQGITRARNDIDRLNEMVPSRRETLQSLQQRYPRVLDDQMQYAVEKQQRLPADLDPTVLRVARLDQLPSELEDEYVRLNDQLNLYEEKFQSVESNLQRLLARSDITAGDQLYDLLEQTVIFEIPSLLSQLNSDLLDISLVQARARTDSIDLVSVDLDMDLALGIASQNRLDWMNARAGLVDTWRAIAFVANDLESFLNIVADGRMGTVGDNPVDFRGSTGTVRMGLEFDAPFTRLLERNTYRQVLIDYQRARRNYYQFIDRVSQELRSIIRSLELNQLNFETRRVAVLSAIQQIVLNDEIRTLNEERGESQGVTAARDIVQALSDLQDAQDAFMGVWITYEVNRRFLDFGLGTMELDARGLWIDPGPVKGGMHPYIVSSCDEGSDLVETINPVWPEYDGVEEVPSGDLLPGEVSPDSDSTIQLFRLPAPKAS